MNTLTSYLTKNFIVTTSKTIGISIVTLFLLPLIIKRLGLELYGIISLTLLFSGISSVVDLGLSKAIVLLSGNLKISQNRVISAALIINTVIALILLVGFVILQLLSVDFLGKDLNLKPSDKFLVLNIGFLMLILMLFNNLCKAILESEYKIHIVTLTQVIYTPTLYLTVFILSYFTTSVKLYTVIPFVLTVLLLLFNVLYLKMNTKTKLVKVAMTDIRFVFKKSLAFLNIGLLNSAIMPLMRYAFVLVVSDVALYAIFDLSFKITMLANSLILSLSTPMFAVFSKTIKTNTRHIINITYKIFYISILFYLVINIGYYFFGHYALNFLDLASENMSLLYDITFVLLLSLGSVAVVEVFYRYFLGKNQLIKAFLLKLIVPVCGGLVFMLLHKVSYTYRFIYSYSVGLFVSTLITALSFSLTKKD